MASPMVEGRIDPHKKAHFTLHLSDRIEDGEVGDYTSVKYNHKPVQPTSSRTTTLTSTSSSTYALTLEDKKAGDKKDVFVFTGTKTVPKKSYVLLLDPATQKATLEPLATTYTFNISQKNGADISSSYSKIYPRKHKDDAPDAAAGSADDLFDESARDDINEDPDPDNPYDFRHFLSKDKVNRGDESEYNIISSPDYRTGTGSALNTPQLPARKPAAAAASKPKASAKPAPKPRKRKSPEPEAAPKKAAAGKKPQAPPAVRLERRATANPNPEPASKPSRKPAAQPPSSKIKSAEIVHSSDESDADADGDADGELDPSPPRTQHRSPSPVYQRPASPSTESDEDEEMEDITGGGGLEIEIEVPDEQPSSAARRNNNSNNNARHAALSSLNKNYLTSPAAGPMSLASLSAANSAANSPNPHAFSRNALDDGVIDFGDIGGRSDEEDDAEGDMEDDDVDVEPMDIGPPAQEQGRGVNRGGVAVEEDDAQKDAEGEDQDLLLQMMEGLAGESSEESEEE